MAVIGDLIENKFEDSEYKKPAAAFKKAKHKLIHLGVKKGTVKGETAGIKVKVEKAVSDVDAGDFDALFIPVSYTHLRAHETDSYLVCRLLLEKKKKQQTVN